jgi:hypothetical protein
MRGATPLLFISFFLEKKLGKNRFLKKDSTMRMKRGGLKSLGGKE